MTLDFDTSMNNYTITDLLSILNFNHTPDESEIVNRVSEYVNMFSDISNADLCSENNREIIDFFYNIQDKLIEYYINNNNNNFNWNYYNVDSLLQYNIETSNNILLPESYHHSIDNISPQYNIDYPELSDLSKEEILVNNNNFIESYANTMYNNVANTIPEPESKTIKNLLFINSNFRKIFYNNDDNQYSSTNFIIELQNRYNNVTKLKIVNSEIPAMMYTFSENQNNNSFSITIAGTTITGTDINESYTITFPDGIWLSNSTTDWILDEYFDIDSTSDSNSNYLKYLTFEISSTSARASFRFKTSDEIDEFLESFPDSDISYDNIANLDLKYSLRNEPSLPYICNNNSSIIQIDENNFSLTCLGNMGFKYSDIYSTISNEYIKISASDSNYDKEYGQTTYNGCLQASNIYGHSAIDSFYVSVDDFTNNYSQSIMNVLTTNGLYLPESILSYVTISRGAFQRSISKSSSDYNYERSYDGAVNIQKFHIKIIDGFGRTVNLNNYPTKFVFEITSKKYNTPPQTSS